MEGAKKSGTSNFSAGTGGFVGIDQLTKSSSSNPKHSLPMKKSKQIEDETPSSTKMQDGEMFILGLLKEQRQEEAYKERVNQRSGRVDPKCFTSFLTREDFIRQRSVLL